MTRRRVVIAVLLLLVLASGGAWLLHQRSQPQRLVLRFHAVVGDEALVPNALRYPNPGGEGRFKVRDFQFFLSNIRLLGDEAEWAEADSYHLLRFDGADARFELAIEGVPRADYRRIAFAIGVDPGANGTIAVAGDLDPNGRMAWSWDVGYKFVLFEGGLEVGDLQIPLVYHVGFDENYRPLVFALDRDAFGNAEAAFDFRVDLMRLFAGVRTVDMAALSNVKFDHADAKLLADNYATMISPCGPACSR